MIIFSIIYKINSSLLILFQNMEKYLVSLSITEKNFLTTRELCNMDVETLKNVLLDMEAEAQEEIKREKYWKNVEQEMEQKESAGYVPGYTGGLISFGTQNPEHVLNISLTEAISLEPNTRALKNHVTVLLQYKFCDELSLIIVKYAAL